MDASVELYRREKARLRGESVEERDKRLRATFLDRLALLRQDMSLRVFAGLVGVPHTTIDSWSKKSESEPRRKDLLAIADRAELPGVPLGLLSVDWLCGLSNEPSREVRVTAKHLPNMLASYLAEQIAEKVEMRGRGELTGMKDGESILRSLVDRGAAQWHVSAVYSRDKLVAYWDILTLLDGEGKVDTPKLEKIVRRLVAPNAPAGDIISWEPPPLTLRKNPPKRGRRVSAKRRANTLP